MAIQVINVGSKANGGGGDALRDAMIKINENFTELYDRTGGDVASSIIGADSTVLVDGPNSSLNADALTGTAPAGVVTFPNISNTPTTVAGYGITDAYTKAQTNQQIAIETNDIKSDLASGSAGAIDASVLTGSLPAIDGSALTGISAGTATSLDGDMKGSVYADDSTLLVDGVNGTLNSSALTKPIALADDEKITFGAGDDLQIWHNAFNSIIQNSTGELQLRGNTIRLLNAATTEDLAFFNNNGSVDLYYDGNKKFETTADGISVTDHIALADGGELRLGTDNDMQISHSGTSGLVKSGTGTLVLQGSTVRIQDAGSSQTAISASNGIATLLFENSTKLETTTDGISVTGKITGLTDPTDAQDAATKAYVDANSGGGGGSAFTNIGVGADDSTIRNISEGESFLILGGTGITTASNAEGNITITGFDGAFGSLSGTPTTLGGYGITDAASTGTDTTFTKDVHFDRGVEEKFQTLTGQSGVVAHNWNDGHVFYHTTPAGDITANFTNVNLTAEYATNVTIIINQGATPYIITAVQIAGSGQTINWQGGSAPTGNANGIDSFSFTILNDGGSYVVLGQMVDFT